MAIADPAQQQDPNVDRRVHPRMDKGGGGKGHGERGDGQPKGAKGGKGGWDAQVPKAGKGKSGDRGTSRRTGAEIRRASVTAPVIATPSTK